MVAGLGFARLAWVLFQPDGDVLAVLAGRVDDALLDRAWRALEALDVLDEHRPALLPRQLQPDGPVRIWIFRARLGPGPVPIPDGRNVQPGRGLDDLEPAPLEVESGHGADLPVAAQQPHPVDVGQGFEVREVVRVRFQQDLVVRHKRRHERHALWPAGWELRLQFLPAVRPKERVVPPDEPAQHARALGDRLAVSRAALVLVNPPFDEPRYPRVRVRVAGSPDVWPHATRRSVAAQHVEELLLAEGRQFVESDVRNLRSLPGENGLVVFEVREPDSDVAGEVVAQPVPQRMTPQRHVKFLALVPQPALVRDVRGIAAEDDGAEPLDAQMAQWLKQESK